MAISELQIEMPSPLPVNVKQFNCYPVQDISPVGSGFTQVLERAPARWVATYTTPPLSDERDMAMQAFLDQLDGSMGSFLAFDPRRPRPYNSGLSGTPWGADAYITAMNNFDSSILLNDVTPGYVFKRGDYISVMVENAWYLHRIWVDKAANGSGVASLDVYPRPIGTTTDYTPRFHRACAEMRLVGRYKKDDRVSDIGPVYTFSAAQHINKY